MEIIRLVRNFINQSFVFDDDFKLMEDASLLEEGVIDSTGVLELVAFIEHTFDITVEDHEIIPANLDSLINIDRYVRGKLNGLHPEVRAIRVEGIGSSMQSTTA